VSWFKRRRRKNGYVDHLQRALKPELYQSTPGTYVDAVHHLASASPDEVRETIDAALKAREDGWLEVQESAEAARAQAEKARHGVRGEQPRKEPTPEPVEVDPDLRPRYSRADHDRADYAAQIAARYMIEEQLQARRRRLGGGDASSIEELTQVARQAAAEAGRFTDTGATAAVVEWINGLGKESS
jgi:hypothetical protein